MGAAAGDDSRDASSSWGTTALRTLDWGDGEVCAGVVTVFNAEFDC
jgi:hypothetical protein